MMRPLFLLLLTLVLASCTSEDKGRIRYDPMQPSEPADARMRTAPKAAADLQPGMVLAQGMIGVTQIDTLGTKDVDTSSSSNQMPLIAGAFQWPIWGDRIDVGLEAGGSFSFLTNGGGFYFGSGGAVVAVSIDTFLLCSRCSNSESRAISYACTQKLAPCACNIRYRLTRWVIARILAQ